MIKLIITQSNYLPWKGYFDALNMADQFIAFDDMQYTRRDWRNRNKIKTRTGPAWLTIPVEVKGKYFQKINETRVCSTTWASDHWKIIYNNYVQAPYFKEYKDVFEGLYRNIKTDNLSEINLIFINCICTLLGIQTRIVRSSDYTLAEGKTERLVDLCKQTGAVKYYTGPAAKAYLDESLFRQENIAVEYIDYTGYKAYHQLYGQFDHYVSIIDLIFNEGPACKKYLKSFDL